MKSFTNSRKFLFGVSVSMVLAMAIGSFALGETQTPASPRAVEAQNSVGATAGAFTVNGGTQGTDYDFTGTSGTDGVLTIHPQSTGTNITISNTGTTTDRIVVDGAATITLAGVNINTSTGSPLGILNDATFDVNILLADDSENSLVSTVSSSPYGGGAAGLQKAGSGDNIGTLTIGVPDGSQGTGKLEATGGSSHGAGIGGFWYYGGSKITITGGEITATGGSGGAGIGGGRSGHGSNITISGGKVTAKGGTYGAGIGGGWYGSGSNITITGGVVTANGGPGASSSGAGIGGGDSGSGSGNNSLNGDAVVLATSGDAATGAMKDALDGFVDGQGGSLLTQGIAFTRQSTSGTWSGAMYGNVALSQDLEIPANLTVPAGQILSIKEGKDVTLSEKTGAKYTVEGELRNNGTVTLPADLAFSGNGKVTTKTDFYLDDGSLYNTGYQTYRINAGVQKYNNLPNPYQLDSSNGKRFINWYYLNQASQKVAISVSVNVLLNEHNFYENTVYTVTVTELENGSITTGVTEAAKNDTVTFTATPDEGYRIVGLPVVETEDGTEITVTAGQDGEYTFTMPGDEVEISATFEGIPYDISVIQPEHGTIDLDTDEAVIGTEISFTATPDEGYRIVGLSVVETEDGTEITVTAGEDGEYTFTMPDAAVEISAAFEGIPYTVTFDSKGGSEVTSQTVAYDNTVPEPDEPTRDGYSFVEWCKDEECTTAWDFGNDKVQGDMTLYAKWLGNEHRVIIPTNPDDHGTVTTDPENPKTGDEVIITVTPEEGYKVDGLPIVKTEDGRIIEVVPTGNPNEYKFIMPDSDVTIEVNFVLISEPEVKTGDSFAGIAALAILGLATTGAALLRKRK